jgi:hypothetical protein
VIAARPATRRHLAALRVVGPALAILVVAVGVARIATAGPGGDLVLERNGLLADYAFDKPAPTSSLVPTFRPGGTATSSGGSIRVGTDGLHVDVSPHRPGTWKGYYLATAATYPANSVVHVRMWRPPRSVPLASQSGILLLAVQTGASTALDYVLVADVVSREHETWIVGYANGNAVYAVTKPLASVPTSSPAEDVTLETNGDSRYAVYFGSRLVYESTRLRLNVAPPLRVYLEVEAKGRAYQTRFQDLWVAAGSSVTVDGLHPGDHLTLTPDGSAPVRAVADAVGQARLPLPLSKAVGTGTLRIDGPGMPRPRRFAGIGYAGGDVYRLTT